MDVKDYIVKSFSEIKDVGCYAFVLDKAYTLYFNMLNKLPPKSIESGTFQQHPKTTTALAGIAWVVSKLECWNGSKRVINYVKEKLEKIDKGLEGKIRCL